MKINVFIILLSLSSLSCLHAIASQNTISYMPNTLYSHSATNNEKLEKMDRHALLKERGIVLNTFNRYARILHFTEGNGFEINPPIIDKLPFSNTPIINDIKRINTKNNLLIDRINNVITQRSKENEKNTSIFLYIEEGKIYHDNKKCSTSKQLITLKRGDLVIVKFECGMDFNDKLEIYSTISFDLDYDIHVDSTVTPISPIDSSIITKESSVENQKGIKINLKYSIKTKEL